MTTSPSRVLSALCASLPPSPELVRYIKCMPAGPAFWRRSAGTETCPSNAQLRLDLHVDQEVTAPV